VKIRNNRLLIIALILQTACHSPQHVVREFVSRSDLPALLYISDPAMFIQFYRPDELTDSLNYFKPEKIMYYLDDSIVQNLKTMYDQIFMKSLTEQGFSVYGPDSISAFFSVEHLRWQLSPVQITFEEHRILFSRELPFNDYTVYFDTVISEYQFNVWLELSPVNGDSTIPVHLLFHSASISDKMKGRFMFDWGLRAYKYGYDFSEADSFVFQQLVENTGSIHANYLFDFFLNRYLYFEKSKQPKKRIYYTYDAQRGKAIPARDNRFIFMQNER
jgi:hypothetical protein